MEYDALVTSDMKNEGSVEEERDQKEREEGWRKTEGEREIREVNG